jgi:hypothetical protein
MIMGDTSFRTGLPPEKVTLEILTGGGEGMLAAGAFRARMYPKGREARSNLRFIGRRFDGDELFS